MFAGIAVISLFLKELDSSKAKTTFRELQKIKKKEKKRSRNVGTMCILN
jgi:hypothetical protein